MTNLEWIKTLDEENMINILCSDYRCPCCAEDDTTKGSFCSFDCKKGVTEWLRAEHKEEADDQ